MKVPETGEAISRDRDENPRLRWRRRPTVFFRAARLPRSRFDNGPGAGHHGTQKVRLTDGRRLN